MSGPRLRFSPSPTGYFGVWSARTALDKKQVLRARARELAREPHASSLAGRAAGPAVEVVEFLLAGERYAVESTRVREVYPLRELTPLPCTPPFGSLRLTIWLLAP